jgi:malonate-semialdehyde dehydrogenase (acetylating)/methylmalonate-semialdehyde dehydrogenase
MFTPSLRRAFSSPPVYGNYINGRWVPSACTNPIDVVCPLTQKVLAKVPQTTEAEFNAAVQAAKDAFPGWAATPISQRVRCMLKYQALLKEHSGELAKAVSVEHGKTHADAAGDVFRGYEVVEHACSFGSLAMGETVQNVATGVDIQSYRVPLGVCAGIAPFNFPAMVPLWMYPLAITLGNTYVLKPSEKVPGTAVMLVDLLKESGVPDGVLNVVHGGPDTVTRVCTHPDIKAVSFVGANTAGEYIYKTASQTGKRCQANMGAKNHAVVMPDADKEDTLNALVGACYGSTGQRCMAVAVVVLVGDAGQWVPDLVAKSKALTVGPAHENPDVAPLQSRAGLERALELITDGAKTADLLLDGRGVKVEGYPDGNWLGPTVIDNAKPGMRCYDEEIFGPAMVIVRAKDL